MFFENNFDAVALDLNILFYRIESVCFGACTYIKIHKE